MTCRGPIAPGKIPWNSTLPSHSHPLWADVRGKCYKAAPIKLEYATNVVPTSAYQVEVKVYAAPVAHQYQSTLSRLSVYDNDPEKHTEDTTEHDVLAAHTVMLEAKIQYQHAKQAVAKTINDYSLHHVKQRKLDERRKGIDNMLKNMPEVRTQ